MAKSNRTEMQTYKVEERTFGTPCNYNFETQKLNNLEQLAKTRICWICCCGWWKLRKSQKGKVEEIVRPICKSRLTDRIYLSKAFKWPDSRI